MKPKYLFASIIFVVVVVAVLVLFTANYVPASSVPPTNPKSDARDASAERVEVQVDVAAPIPTTTAVSVANQATPVPDGPSLLESRCAKCHIPQKLDQIEKPRAEWELILAKMETLGVQLSETEKAILLDYLSATDKP